MHWAAPDEPDEPDEPPMVAVESCTARNVLLFWNLVTAEINHVRLTRLGRNLGAGGLIAEQVRRF